MNVKHVAILDMSKPSHVLKNFVSKLSCFTFVHAARKHGKFVATKSCNESVFVHRSF